MLPAHIYTYIYIHIYIGKIRIQNLRVPWYIIIHRPDVLGNKGTKEQREQGTFGKWHICYGMSTRKELATIGREVFATTLGAERTWLSDTTEGSSTKLWFGLALSLDQFTAAKE